MNSARPTLPAGLLPPPGRPPAGTALVLFSGGQDSTTCLVWAQRWFQRVYAVAFDYGQRHAIELEQARRIADLCEVPLRVLPLLLPSAAQSSLTNAALPLPLEPVSDMGEQPHPDLPSTFVPGRNLFFLASAGALAYSLGIADIVTGVCQTDYSGYPDCRAPFIAAAQQALSLAMDRPFTLHTPLMALDKAQTWLLAEALSARELIVTHTHSCYAGERHTLHAWGYGCGQCAACQLRARGFQQAFSS